MRLPSICRDCEASSFEAGQLEDTTCGLDCQLQTTIMRHISPHLFESERHGRKQDH